MRVTSSHARRRHARGFTLIELLVTLVVVSVGLLGVAKMQAAAIAETGVARTRSLMTFQAEALAAAMRANKGFWQSSSVYSQTISIPAGGQPTLGNTVLPPSTDNTCVSTTACTLPAHVAYDDVHTWATAFVGQFPTASGTITCAGSATVPVTCDITLSWTEHSVAVNRTTAAGTTNTPPLSTMVLHVQP